MSKDENTLIGKFLPTLQSIAERVTGSFEDGQDLVQDTLEKWFKADLKKIDNHKSYLIRALINNCQSHLRNLKTKKENLESFHANLIKSNPYFEMDVDFLDKDSQFKRGIDFIYNTLKPLERGVFILREVFNLDYEVIQDVVGKKADNCRQALSRAKVKLGLEIKKGEILAQTKSDELGRIIKEASSGKFQELFSFLNLELKNI